MLLSNLHSFHFVKKLQNATAFPAHVYRKINNRHGVNSKANRPYVTIRQEQTQQFSHVKAGQTKSSAHFGKSPFHEQREPVTIEGSATRKPPEPAPPVINDVVNTQQKTQDKKQNETKQNQHLTKRNIWKPGHGAIEKVDKLTGEIVHLVEEYA